MSNERKSMAANCIYKYRKGDPVSDQELECAIKELESATTFISLLDDRYRLMNFDMILLLDQLKSSQECRRRHDKEQREKNARLYQKFIKENQ